MTALLLTALVLAAPPEGKKDTSVLDKSRSLLAAWALKDARKVLSMMDLTPGVMTGPDVSEICHDAGCAEKLLKDSFALFDTAKFGELQVLSVHQAAGLASAVFDVPLETQVGQEKRTQVLRFTTVWRQTGAEWKVVQLVRSAPTVQRSAKEILKDNVLK